VRTARAERGCQCVPVDSTRVMATDGTALHVGLTGQGPDVVVLSGGPGCVQYLESTALAPPGMRAWFPEPRGVGRSGGGPHGMAQAIADLEAIRRAVGVGSWAVLGHSWGCDVAVRYALDHPDAVTKVVGVAGCGVQKDRTWSETYHALQHTQPTLHIAYDASVHEALTQSYLEWIHEPSLFRTLADSPVPMVFVAAELDIRPSWPLEQLAALVPAGRFWRVPLVGHDFWSTHPDVWRDVVERAFRTSND
jgi:proline iminopeptidase